MMNKKFAASVLVSFFIATSKIPSINAQSFLLNTGIPASSTVLVFGNANWYAAQFTASAGMNVTLLGAYFGGLSTGNPNNFTFDIYADNNSGVGFIGGRNLTPLSVTTVAYGGSAGWTSASVNWTVPASGNYWLAIEQSDSGRNLQTIQLPEETSTSTGPFPALAFATSTGSSFGISQAPVGLEVAVAAVPEPAIFSLVLTAGALLLALTRRTANRLNMRSVE